MSTVKNYLSLIKFSHTIFAMPFALIGFFIGIFEYSSIIPGWHNRIFSPLFDWELLFTKLILVILCMIFARSAAMAFNRYLDRRFDAKNPRTAIREIPAGIISANNALAFTVTASLLFILACYVIIGIGFFLSRVDVLIVLGCSYPKRCPARCHFI